MSIRGLGPHGERTSSFLRLDLTEREADIIRDGHFTVAIVLHTTTSDWSKQQIAGITRTLGQYSTAVVEVVDCEFNANVQIAALKRLAKESHSAIISIPVGSASVSEAHRIASSSGTKLVLLDNAPIGLLPGIDYVSVVSADNFGLGQIAAELLSVHLQPDCVAGIISYGIDFFATHQRDIAFRKWMETNRPDVSLKTARFTDVNLVAPVIDGFVVANANLAGLFAVWDAPAVQAVSALRARSRFLPITTIDLGNKAAIEMADGGMIKGIGAQQPYDQGINAAIAALQALVGRTPPAWIALPGISVTPKNLIEAYQTVWHAPAPRTLIAALCKYNERKTPVENEG